ncbi:MAG TPA: hypothetical protein VJP88_11615 [Caulobacteraceae bacterium]|nr:hypothetical protein [Caulobacteraceae bacterium]
MRTGLAVVAFLALAACSKSDDTRLKQDMHGVGHDLTAAANSVAADSDIRDVGAQTKRTAQDAGEALKHTAAEAKAMAQGAADEAKDDARQVGHETRSAADDARHNAEGD